MHRKATELIVEHNCGSKQQNLVDLAQITSLADTALKTRLSPVFGPFCLTSLLSWWLPTEADVVFIRLL